MVMGLIHALTVTLHISATAYGEARNIICIQRQKEKELDMRTLLRCKRADFVTRRRTEEDENKHLFLSKNIIYTAPIHPLSSLSLLLVNQSPFSRGSLSLSLPLTLTLNMKVHSTVFRILIIIAPSTYSSCSSVLVYESPSGSGVWANNSQAGRQTGKKTHSSTIWQWKQMENVKVAFPFPSLSF